MFGFGSRSKGVKATAGALARGNVYLATGLINKKPFSKELVFMGTTRDGVHVFKFARDPSRSVRARGDGPTFRVTQAGKSDASGKLTLHRIPGRASPLMPLVNNKPKPAAKPVNKPKPANKPVNKPKPANKPANKPKKPANNGPKTVSAAEVYRAILKRECIVGLTADTRKQLAGGAAPKSLADIVSRARQAGCLV